MRKFAILRNPVAGWDKSKFTVKIADTLEGAGADVDFHLTSHPGHATDLARSLSASDPDRVIVAAGGDGTVREVTEGIIGTNATMAIIPAGNANVLARELGYPLSGGRRVADFLLATGIIDLYPFTVEKDGIKTVGLCWLGAGYDASVLKVVDTKTKEKWGRLAFIPATIKTLCSGSAAKGWHIAANIQNYGGPYRLGPTSPVTTPGMILYRMDEAGGFARIGDMLAMLGQGLGGRAQIEDISTPTLLGGDTIPLQLDGDYIGEGVATLIPGNRPVRCIGITPGSQTFPG